MAPRRRRSKSRAHDNHKQRVPQPKTQTSHTIKSTSKSTRSDSNSSQSSSGGRGSSPGVVNNRTGRDQEDEDSEIHSRFQDLFDAYNAEAVHTGRVAEAKAKLGRAYHGFRGIFSIGNVMIGLELVLGYWEWIFPIFKKISKWILILAACVGLPVFLLVNLLGCISHMCSTTLALAMVSKGLSYTPLLPDICAEVMAFYEEHQLAKMQLNQTFDSVVALHKLSDPLRELSENSPSFQENVIDLNVQIKEHGGFIFESARLQALAG